MSAGHNSSCEIATGTRVGYLPHLDDRLRHVSALGWHSAKSFTIAIHQRHAYYRIAPAHSTEYDLRELDWDQTEHHLLLGRQRQCRHQHQLVILGRPVRSGSRVLGLQQLPAELRDGDGGAVSGNRHANQPIRGPIHLSN